MYGGYGHTGRFVLAELLKRRLTPVLSGRDPLALDDLGSQYPDLEQRPAAVSDDQALAAALREVAAVINCAGPFLDTGTAIAAAAVGAGVHYLDISAEQAAVQQIYRAHEEPAWRTDVAVVPAMAFDGGSPTSWPPPQLPSGRPWTRSSSPLGSTGGGRRPAHGTRDDATPRHV